MAKRSFKGSFASLALNRESEIPLYEQITMQLRGVIANGHLKPGERLASTRTLARDWGVSRNTVLQVFDALCGEGYLESRVGDGTYVADSVPDLDFLDLRPAPETPAPCQALYPFRHLSQRGKNLMQQHQSTPPERPVPFMPDVPDVRGFPLKTWLRLMNEVSGRLTGENLVHVSNTGDESLRQAIAHHVRTLRNVDCSASQVIVTSGSQQGLDLVTRMLLDPGDPVWMEEPGYVGMRATFRANACNVMSVPVDGEGLDVNAGREMFAAPRLICVSPARQYPVGAPLSKTRRDALVEYAARSGAWVLEDDYDSEMRYEGTLTPALQSIDQAGRVIYMGTFSKTLLPSFRLGFLIVPDDIAGPFARARSVIDRHAPLMEQMVLAEFIHRGFYAAHLRQMRITYYERQQAMLEVLDKVLDYRPPDYETESGMHFMIPLKDGVDDRAVSNDLWQRGIVARPLSIYYNGTSPRPGLLLGFAAFSPQTIRDAGEDLAILKPMIAR